MPPPSNPTLDALATEVTEIETAADSAIALMNGIAGRIQAAVDKVLAGGVTAEQLAPVQAEVDGLKAKRQELAAAVAANTPAE